MTTGAYCRPSCPSRLAKRENAQLHDTLESARATGFRPCKRCKPESLPADAENAALVAKACRIIEENEVEPSLDELARAGGLSSSYFHRVFKAATGVTPKTHASAYRAHKVRDGLALGNTVTEAFYDASFGSSGRFFEKSTGMLGMTPTQYRSGGVDEELGFAVGETSLGATLVASSKKGVASILLGNDPDELVRDLQDRFPKVRLIGADRDYEKLVARVVGFVECPRIGGIFRLMCAAPPFNKECGRPFRKFQLARRYLTRTLPDASMRLDLTGPLPAGVPPIIWQLPFPAIVLFATTARFPVTRGALNASAN